MRKDLHFDIDLTLEPRYTKEFVVKQNDSINLFINLKSDGVPVSVAEQIPRLYVRKPDSSIVVQGGTEELGDGTIILDANRVIVELKNNALNTTGLCYAELELEDERGTLITQTFIFEVIDRLNNVENAIGAVDDIYLLGEIEQFIIQAKIDMALLKEQIEAGLIKIDEFNNFVVEKSEELQKAIDEVIANIDFRAQDYLNKITAICEEYGFKITKLGEEYLGKIADKGNSVLDEIRECASNEVDKINETGANTIDAIKAEEAGILENLENITIDGTGMLEDAVKLAEKRLQEQTVQSLWEVQEKSATEQENLGKVSRQEQSNISQTAREQIERVNQAGADMVELVENLDANIEAGIADIERTINTGKSEINELSSAQVERIRAEGEEIVAMVENIETITGDHIERINRAGESNVSRVESKADAGIREINSVVAEQKELLKGAGNEKLEEINSILGVSKGEVEELLETTRQELQTHRTEIATRVNLGKQEIDTLKNNSLVEMTNTKDGLLEEILGAEIALKEDFTQLRDQYVKEIDDKGTSKVDALQRMIDRIDALQLAVDKKLEVSEKRAETLENTLENVDNKIAEIRPVLDNLTEMRNICVSLQQENAEARENIEELDFLHTESDVRIVELRRLIELAKQYEDVVQAFIDSRGGNHEEINARLDALEEALAELEIPSIDHLATKEELEAKVGEVIDMIPEEVDLSPYATKEELNEAVNPLATKEELEEAINSIGTPTPGKVENVAVTNWGIPADLSIFDTLPIPDSYESVLCGKLSTYECVVAFFKKKVDKASITLNYGYGYRYLYIKDYEIAGFYYYTSGAWKAFAKSQYANYFGGSTSGDCYIKELFYHDFNIYDPQGNLWRQSYDAEIGENTVNDFNDAIVVNDYAVIQKDGEILLNSPIEDMSYTGMLEVEIADGVIKQELNTDNGITYKRFCKNGSWSNWDRCVDSNMKNDIVLANKGSFVKSISFVSTPASIAPMQPYDEYDVYPRAKHNLKYYDGSYYYNIFFFQDLTKESGKYITYIPVVSGNAGYNRITFNNLALHEDYVVYRTDSKTVVPTKFTNTTISTININNNNFRLYHYDFDMYNEDLSGIALYAPTEGLNDFNEASENGYYMVNMDAVDFKDVANGPDAKVEGVVSGNLEVVSGKQILTLTSHNKTYIRNIGEQWKDISANSVSKDIVSSIKVSDKELPPAFLKTLPIDERYFRQQDKKTIIIRRNETEYMVFRTNHATLKPYLSVGSTNTTFYLGNNQQYVQADTYNTTTGKWTTSLPTGTSSYTVSCVNTHFKVFHSDVDIYTSSNCTEVYQEAISIDFDVEKTMNDFNNAVEVGTYGVDINEEDVILNAPITGELKGILKVVKADNFIEQIVETTNSKTYKRFFNGSEWTEWTTPSTSGGANCEDMEDIKNQLEEFKIPFPDKVKTVEYTNADGGLEKYSFLDINGLKLMFINYTYTETEYNGASSGMFYRTFNFPEEAQIFNQIMFASQISYSRSTNNHLSRIMQNTEILSNISVRARYRHDELTKPYIDRVTVMIWGF